MTTSAVERLYFVYILTNARHTVLYTGVTRDLKARVYQHREKLIPGFTSRYNVSKLVFYEVFADPRAAITREKQVKSGSRQKKIDSIRRLRAKRSNLGPAGLRGSGLRCRSASRSDARFVGRR